MSKSRSRSAMLNTGAGMAAKIINIITGFIMRSAFIYTLGIEYAGVSSLFTDVLTILSFAELGIGSAIAYAMYEPVAHGDKKRIAALMDFYKKAYRIVALTIMVVGLALIPFLDILVPPDKIGAGIRDEISSRLVLIYILYLADSAVSYLSLYRSTLLTAYQEGRYASMIMIVFSVLRVSGECLILFTIGDYIAYLIYAIIISRTQNIVISAFTKKRYPEECKPADEKLSRQDRKGLMRDVRAMMLYRISEAVTNGCDSVVISSFLGSGWVGLTGNYTMVTYRVNIVASQFFEALTPSVGNLAVDNDSEKQYRTFKILQFISFWLCCFCSVCFVVLLDPFVTLWLGESYVLPLGVSITLAASFYLAAIIQPVASFRTSNGLFVQARFAPVAMVIINIVLSIILVRVWGSDPASGVVGVKLATIIAQLVTVQWFDPFIVFRQVFKKRLHHYFRRWLTHLGITAALCAGTYLLCQLIFPTGGVLSFLGKIAVCLVLPNAAIFLIFRRTNEFAGFMTFVKKLLHKNKEAAS